ncbi:unnamed protein product, partial [Didymodactylos carnosus]
MLDLCDDSSQINMVSPLQNKKRKIFSCKCCGISFEKWLKLSSAFLVSLMIGIFTIVTTLQQNQQADELQIETVYTSYITEMSELFMIKDHQKILRGNNIGMSERLIFGRAKTLTTLRQIDIRRKTFLILFLYEANLLNVSKNPIDLASADLTGINLGDIGYNLNSISLTNCILINASFSKSNLEYANFYGSTLNGANFSYTRLFQTNFTNCELSQTDFRHSFIYTLFDNVNMVDALLPESVPPLIANAIVPNGSYVYSTVNKKSRRTNLINDGEPLCANVSSRLIRQQKWIYVGAKTPIATIVSCHVDRQKRCCFGGRKVDNNNSDLDNEYLYQTTNVFDYSRLIDSGKAKYNLSAYLGGMKYYTDFAYIDIGFLINNMEYVASNTTILRLGPVTNTERQNRTTLLYRELVDIIPKYTRQVTLKM